MENKVVIGLGTNWDCEKNLGIANRLLIQYFDSIRFSEPVYTEPIGLPDSNQFLNQVAIAYTKFPLEEVKIALKDMEKFLGRTPQGKEMGIIPIDIDLLQWNEHILKAVDLEREDIKNGIKAISSVSVK